MKKLDHQGTSTQKKVPMKYHENILVFYKKHPTYNPIKTYGHKRKVSKGQAFAKAQVGKGCYGEQKGADYDSTEIP